MAFVTLAQSLIAVGKPIVKSIFQSLKDNQDDINTRTLSLEAAAGKVIFFDGVIYNAATYATATGLLFHRVQSGIDITDVKIAVFDFTGLSSGTLEIDVQVASSADFAASVSALTTKPTINLATASNYDESSNAVLSLTNKVLTEGMWIRIDVTSLPTGLGKFGVYIIGEPS